MPSTSAEYTSWNGTNGGVINGGVSQTNTETCKIGRICAKLAGFARNLRKFAKLFLQNLRKFARKLRPRLLRYCLFLSEHVPTARANGRSAAGRLLETYQRGFGLQLLVGLPKLRLAAGHSYFTQERHKGDPEGGPWNLLPYNGL